MNQLNNKANLIQQKNNNIVEIIDKSGVETCIEKILMQNIALLPNNGIINRIKTSAGFYIANRKDLMELSSEGKMQMVYGVLKEAMLGLEAGTDYDIVPFKGKPTICRKKEGYFKIIDMIKPAEIIKCICNVITTGDDFFYNPVTGEINHQLIGERYQDYENIIGSYAYVKFANGFEGTIFLYKEDLDKIKNTSPSGKTEFSPWNSQSIKMVKTKTMKELAKDLITLFGNKLNSVLLSAINSDEISVQNVDDKGYITNDNKIYEHPTDKSIQEAEYSERNDSLEAPPHETQKIKEVDINEL